jgi:hypothetical protein
MAPHRPGTHYCGSVAARRGALRSFIETLAATVLIIPTVVNAAAAVGLAGWSQEAMTLVVIAGVVTAAGIAAMTTLDRQPLWQS